MKTIGLLFDDTGHSENADDILDFDKMNLGQLREFAIQAGIDFPAGAKKSELLEAVKQAYDEKVPY